MDETNKQNVGEFLLVTTTRTLTDNIKKEAYNNAGQYDNFTILILGLALVVFTFITAILLIMVFCYMERRNSYKTDQNNLADAENVSTLNQVDFNNNKSYSNNPSSKTSDTNSLNITISTKSLTNKSDTNSDDDTVSSINSITFTSTKSNSLNNSLIKNSNTKAHIYLSMPIAKPSLNELKPQLSIKSKMKAKTLFERRGSNNSLTLSLNSNKKKLQITTPTKECANIEFLSKQSRILTINELIDISKSPSSLYNEFYYLPFNHSESFVPSSGIKNRYKTIVPNESTRVSLPIKNNDPLSCYINANYITGYKSESKAYIAAQGPMSNTIDDFWRMIWNERVSSIVMITKLVERNKNKCELYFPADTAIAVDYNDIKVTVRHITYAQDYEIRQLQIVHNNETRVFYHYWYTSWPDHNLPENPDALIELIKLVDNDQKFDDGLIKGPALVHCSAGIGRTGCFLALSIGIKQIDLNNIVDIVKIISNLRIDRGGMIQTLEQYEFIYQVLAYYCIYYKKYPYNSNMSISQSTGTSSPSLSLRSPTISSTFSFNTQ